MYRVMLVDDEYMILRGMQKLIDWHALGYEIVATLQNPVQALTELQTMPVDLLISDMNMPEIAGPEFLAKVRAQSPDIEIVVLSGYDSFAYLKSGVQQNAVDYLRKPVDPVELTQTLQRVTARIEARQAAILNADLARQVQVRDLVTSGSQRSLNQFKLADATGRLIMVLNPSDETNLVVFLRQSPGFIGYFRDGQDIVSVFVGSEATMAQVLHVWPQSSGPQYRPLIVGPRVAATDFPNALQQVIRERNRQYFFEKADGLTMLDQAVDETPSFAFNQIKHEVAQSGDRLDDWLQQRFDDLFAQRVSVEVVRQFALLVLLALNENASENMPLKPSAIMAINRFPTIGPLRKLLVQTADILRRHQDEQYSPNVQRVLTLIKRDYAQELTLAGVADTLHLSPVYLGQLIRHETERTFAQYLNDWRVLQAVRLLQTTTLDVTDIGREVGYQTTSYFFKVFKEQMHLSPKEYRRQLA